MHGRKTKPSLTIALLALVFIVPILLAAWLYNQRATFGKKGTNHGLLLSPPVTMETLQNPGKWALIVFTPDACNALCYKALHFLRQIQRASGKNRNRIVRMLLSDRINVLQGYPQVLLRSIGNISFEKAIAAHASLPTFATSHGAIFIADPHDNLILAYPLDANYMDVFNDLQHLLKVSQIG